MPHTAAMISLIRSLNSSLERTNLGLRINIFKKLVPQADDMIKSIFAQMLDAPDRLQTRMATIECQMVLAKEHQEEIIAISALQEAVLAYLEYKNMLGAKEQELPPPARAESAKNPAQRRIFTLQKHFALAHAAHLPQVTQAAIAAMNTAETTFTATVDVAPAAQPTAVPAAARSNAANRRMQQFAAHCTAPIAPTDNAASNFVANYMPAQPLMLNSTAARRVQTLAQHFTAAEDKAAPESLAKPAAVAAAKNFQNTIVEVCAEKNKTASEQKLVTSFNEQKLTVHLRKEDESANTENRLLDICPEDETGHCKTTLKGNKSSWDILFAGMIKSNRFTCTIGIKQGGTNIAIGLILALIANEATSEIEISWENAETEKLIKEVLNAHSIYDDQTKETYNQDQLQRLHTRLFGDNLCVAARDTCSAILAHL